MAKFADVLPLNPYRFIFRLAFFTSFFPRFTAAFSFPRPLAAVLDTDFLARFAARTPFFSVVRAAATALCALATIFPSVAPTVSPTFTNTSSSAEAVISLLL
jgi:hypothetical protein